MNKDYLAKALKYCAYQERCHEEVRTKLLEIGARGLELEEIIVYLIEHDFLNEERFAIIYAGSKFRQKNWGWTKIKQELKLRKISNYCIEKARKEVFEHDYQSTLEKLIHKKRTTLTKGTLPVIKNKIAKYCISKGYEPELVWEQINILVVSI